MTENIKVKKIWIYIFYIWIGFGIFSFYYYKTHDLTDIIDKSTPFFVPYFAVAYLIFCGLFLKISRIFEFLKGRIGNIFFGIFFIIISLDELHSDEIYYGRLGVAVPKIAFIVLLFIGVCFLLFGAFKQVKEKNLNVFICVKCKKTFDNEFTDNQKCPKCNGTVVRLKSFFKQGHSFVND